MNHRSNPHDLPPQRLHPVAALIAVLKTLRSLLPLALVLLFTQRREGSSSILMVALFAVGASLVEGIGGWVRYRYSVSAGELRVERGFFVRQRIAIPAERVQTVDTSAGVLQRAFGLVKVEVKTAAGTQVVMSAITNSAATDLRLALSAEPSTEQNAGPPRELARYALTPRELLLAASTSGRIGVILSGVAWVYSRIDDFVEERLIDALTALELSDSISKANPLLVVLLVLSGLVVAFVASVIAEVARFGGFSVVRTGDQLVIRRGIFERREVAISLERIQAIRIVEGLLRQPLGYAAIIVETAGHAEERGQSTQLHPFLHRSRWHQLLRDLTPEHAIEPRQEHPPRRALRRFIVRPMVLGTVLALALSLSLPYGWLAFGLVLGAPWLGWLRYRDAAVGISGQVLLLKRRGLERVTAIVRRRRIQYAVASSSVLQRRKRLANLTCAVASGTGGSHFSVPELDADLVDDVVVWSNAAERLPEPFAEGRSSAVTAHSSSSSRRPSAKAP